MSAANMAMIAEQPNEIPIMAAIVKKLSEINSTV